MRGKKVLSGFLCIIIIALVGLGIKIYLSGGKSKNKEYPDYVQTITVNDEFFKSMNERELIFYKVINSIDFYKSASGEYEVIDNNMKEKKNIKFFADIPNKKSYAKMTSADKSEDETIIYNENKIEADNIKKTYKEYKGENLKSDENIKKLKPKDRYNSKKNNEYIYREDGEFLVSTAEMLFNQEVQTYLKDDNNWESYKETQFLNRDVAEIMCKFGFVDKNGTVKLRLAVDKKTGVILKIEELNKDAKVIKSRIMHDIKIDNKIDDNVYLNKFDGYKKMN